MWLCARIVPTGLGSNGLGEERGSSLLQASCGGTRYCGMTARVCPRRTGTTCGHVQRWVSALLLAEILVCCSS